MRLLITLLPLVFVSHLHAQCPVIEVRLDAGDPAGASSAEFPHMHRDGGGGLHVIWSDARDGFDDIYYVGSSDGGDTWSFPEQRLNVGAAVGTVRATFPHVTSGEGGGVYAAWTDDRNSGAFQQTTDVFFNSSSDGGGTWEADDVRLNTSAPAISTRVAGRVWLETAPGGIVYAVWAEERNGSTVGLRFNASGDGGLTWLPEDVRIDQPGEPSDLVFAPVLKRVGTVLHLFWRVSSASGETMRYTRSLDGGANWDPEQSLSTATGLPNRNAMGGPLIEAEGDVLVAAWTDRRHGGHDVFVTRSVDAGQTWLPQEIRLDGDGLGAASSTNLALAKSDSGELVAAWEDTRGGSADIYVSRSADGGASWDAMPTRIDLGSAPGERPSRCPAIAVGPPRTYATWLGRLNGEDGAYANASLDGVQWLGTETRVDPSGFPAVSPFCQGPLLAMDETGLAHTVWLDIRDGETDLYYARCGDLFDPNDCDPSDPGTHTSPAEFPPPRLQVAKELSDPAGIVVSWTDFAPLVGGSVLYDLAQGDLPALHASGSFAAAGCNCEDLTQPRANGIDCPSLGGPLDWYLVRAQNSCGVSSFGDSAGAPPPDPRDGLDDTAGPCDP